MEKIAQIRLTPKKTLHIVTSYQGSSRIESYWKEAFNVQDFDNYNINVIEGQQVSHDSQYWEDQYYKFTQNKFILDLFARNKINNGDVFIFTEALNYLLIPLTFYRHEFNLDIKFIGFWGNSVLKYQRSTTRWGKEFFYSTFNAYDLNCFPTDQHLKLFNWRFRAFVGRRTKSAVTGYPFSFLYDRFKPEIEKENIVVFPWVIKDEIQTAIFKGLKSDIPNFDFILAQKDHNQRDLYLNLLDKSKGMFWAGDKIDDPVMIFEGMCKGLIPFLPTKTFYYHNFPDHYLYYKGIIEPRLSSNKPLMVIRRRFQVVDFLIEKLNNYNYWEEEVRKDAKLMMEQYYNTEIFKQELCQLN